MSTSGQRGRLKILLGYAAGVGKTYKALEELHELKQQGKDVVIGYFEPHGRQDTISKTQGLELIPRRRVSYRGAAFEEMDLEAILRRHPQVCMVDEFAHTNVPGSERVKRWKDVQILLDAGIDVLTNLNVQHLESLNDQVTQFSGIRVRETIPDWVVKQADEVVMIDLPPQALLNRLRRGVVYAPDKAERALENFFKEPTLAALRELALRQAAHEIDLRQDIPDRPLSPGPAVGRRGMSADSRHAKSEDRILIHVSPDPSTAALVRRGKRVADFLNADCFAVCVLAEGDLQSVSPVQREALSRHLNFARNLQIETQIVQGKDDAQSLVQFARQHQITQLFVLRPRARIWRLRFRRNLVQQVVRLARDMQVTVVAERRRA